MLNYTRVQHVLFYGLKQGVKGIKIVGDVILFEVDAVRSHHYHWAIIVVPPISIEMTLL